MKLYLTFNVGSSESLDVLYIKDRKIHIFNDYVRTFML